MLCRWSSYRGQDGRLQAGGWLLSVGCCRGVVVDGCCVCGSGGCVLWTHGGCLGGRLCVSCGHFFCCLFLSLVRSFFLPARSSFLPGVAIITGDIGGPGSADVARRQGTSVLAISGNSTRKQQMPQHPFSRRLRKMLHSAIMD